MKKKLTDPITTAVVITVSYYLCCLPHEWSHGLIAWLFGYKSSPFSVRYGGMLLLHCDENVPYDKILDSGLGYQAALIGIAGITYNALMLVLCLFFLKKAGIRRNPTANKFFYWFSVFSLCPILGYIPNGTFSAQGDVGRFVSGMNISPWLVFIPGTLVVGYLVYVILFRKLKNILSDLNISSPMIQRLYLWYTVFVLFFLIYTHGYNPFSDQGASLLSKGIAVTTILVALVLTYLLDPGVGHLAPCRKTNAPDS